MKKYQFISGNEQIQNYVHEMGKWMEDNTKYTYEEIYNMFKFDALDIKQLFEPYPETIFHDDPAKWAELIAVKWDIIEEKELEFV